MAQRLYVSVCGNIGAGKTSLVERLCQEFQWQPYYEGVTGHPYLDDYYRDMPRWGFHTQIYFLTQRLRQQQEIAQIPISVCQDRSIFEDHEIFAKSLHLQGILSDRDYNTYRLLFDAITPFISKPDLLVYLKASVPTLMSRIEQRSRGCESGITLDYLEHLNERYSLWMEGFRYCPVLTLDADRLDFVRCERDFRFIVEEVKKILPLALRLPI